MCVGGVIHVELGSGRELRCCLLLGPAVRCVILGELRDLLSMNFQSHDICDLLKEQTAKTLTALLQIKFPL